MDIYKRKWFFYVLVILFTIIIIMKYLSLKVYANEFSDTYYYGNIVNSYKQYNNEGYRVYTYPQGTIIFKFDLWDTQYIAICSNRNNIVNNGSNKWGLYRQVTYFNYNNVMTSNLYGQFFQMEGYDSDNFYTIDNVQYVIRTMTITEYIEGLPYFFVWSNRTEGPRQILEGILKGYKEYTNGVNIENINTTIDTSNIESLITDSNNINQSIDETNKTIALDIADIKSGSGSGSGLTESDRNIFSDIRMYIIMIFMVVALMMTRIILKNIYSNVRGV